MNSTCRVKRLVTDRVLNYALGHLHGVHADSDGDDDVLERLCDAAGQEQRRRLRLSRHVVVLRRLDSLHWRLGRRHLRRGIMRILAASVY